MRRGQRQSMSGPAESIIINGVPVPYAISDTTLIGFERTRAGRAAEPYVTCARACEGQTSERVDEGTQCAPLCMQIGLITVRQDRFLAGYYFFSGLRA